MSDTKKIIRILLVINSLQLAAGLLAWGYVGKMSLKSSNYTVFAAMGLMLFSSMIILVGLYLAFRSRDNRFEEIIRDLEELNTTLRSQRHDYLNHFQVIYGLMELDEYEEARKYLQPVFKDIMKAGRALKTAQPAVNALLQAKMEAAENNGIEVCLDVHSDLKCLPLEAWNLCKVLANIIDNAVRALTEEEMGREKQLKISVSEEEGQYLFSIMNNGPMIPEDLRESIFRQGISTKKEQGHGMGLYIVQKIVRDAGGIVELKSDDEYTVFHVVLPKTSTR